MVLARDARPQRDPGLPLRVAAASASTGIPIAASTLARLADTAAEPRAPWSRDALDNLLVPLSAGPTAVTESSRRWTAPGCGAGSSRNGARCDLPPRDQVHTWTVDRHLVETVSRASAFTTRVSRPDLLVLGALLHDIGRAEVAITASSAPNWLPGWGATGAVVSDVRLLSAIVRHHLLLPNAATRRDLQDPAVINDVVEAIGGDPVLLELLHVLPRPIRWPPAPGVGDWKATLIGDLVRRCRAMMAGEPEPEPEPVPGGTPFVCPRRRGAC